MEGCTFSPETLNYKSNIHKSGGVTHGDRNLDLYAKKPKGWFKDQKQKTTEDYELERSQADLKFAPQINDPEIVEKRLQKNKQGNKIDEIPGMDKVRDRMERARQ